MVCFRYANVRTGLTHGGSSARKRAFEPCVGTPNERAERNDAGRMNQRRERKGFSRLMSWYMPRWTVSRTWFSAQRS